MLRFARAAWLAAGFAIAIVGLLRGQTPGRPPFIDPELLNDVQSARRDLDQYWRARVQNYVSPADVVMIEAPTETDCGAFPQPTAAYCISANRIYWDVNLFADQFRLGDFAPVFILAHEWGHLMQYRLGFRETSRGLMNIQLELQADCLGASWAADAQKRGLLDEGDDDEAIGSLRRTPGLDTPWFDPKSHGTPGQRIDAFLFGFQGRDCTADAFFDFLKSQHGIDPTRAPQTPTPQFGSLRNQIPKQVGRFTLVNVRAVELSHSTDAIDAEYRTPDGLDVLHVLVAFASAEESNQMLDGAVSMAIKEHGQREIKRQDVVDRQGRKLGTLVVLQGQDEVVYWTNGHLLGVTKGPNDIAWELYNALPY